MAVRKAAAVRSRSFLRRLTTNEWLTFLVAVGSLVVSF